MRKSLLLFAFLAGCVAAPPPIPPPALAVAPGWQDPSLARDAALDSVAIATPGASSVSQRQFGPVTVSALTLPDAIFFDFGVATPRPDSGPTLDALARALAASPPDSVLTVAGNTDAIGTASANQALSEARARAVITALAGRGIDPRRLAAIGFGASRPITSNDTEQDRAMNRRVELALSPSFAANTASFTALVPSSPVRAIAIARPTLARRPAPLNVRPNRPDVIERNSLGPPVSY